MPQFRQYPQAVTLNPDDALALSRNGTGTLYALAGLFQTWPNAQAAGLNPGGLINGAAALQAWHDALPASGGGLFFPAGTYLINGPVTFTKPVTLVGMGRQSATITTSSPTADVFSVAGANGFSVVGLAMTASVTRTAGRFIYALGANRLTVSGLFAQNYYQAVGIDGGAEITICDSQFFSGTASATAPDSCAIDIGATTSVEATLIQNNYIKGQNGGAQTTYGIRLRWVDVVNLVANTVIWSGTALRIDPANGQTSSLVFGTGNTLDTSVNGAVIQPAAGGLVERCSFDNGWCGVQTQNGCVVDGSAGTVDGVTLSNSHLVAGVVAGANITGANARNIKLAGNYVSNNGIGIRLSAAVNVKVIGNIIGAVDGASQNTTGMTVDNTVTGEVDGNTFAVNGTNFSGVPATALAVGSNRGLQRLAYTPTPPASTGGVLTTASAVGEFEQRGQIVTFRVQVTITTNGTGSGGITVGLPMAAATRQTFNGRAVAISGKAVQAEVGATSNSLTIYSYDGTYPGASGEIIIIDGVYAVQ